MKKIYIIHGWTYTLNAWDACVQELERAGFEPVMLRVPGLTANGNNSQIENGETDKPGAVGQTHPSDKIWTLEDYVEWLDDALPQRISGAVDQVDEEIIVVGHSNGGRIAIALAAQSPERISKLVLIAAAGVPHNGFITQVRRIVFGTIAKWGKIFTNSPKIRTIFYRLIGAKDYGRAPTNMRETMKNLIAVDLVPRLALIKIPTLIIWGTKDKATPVGDAKVMNQAIAGSKLVILEGVGHSPHQAEPQRVAQEISSWLT